MQCNRSFYPGSGTDAPAPPPGKSLPLSVFPVNREGSAGHCTDAFPAVTWEKIQDNLKPLNVTEKLNNDHVKCHGKRKYRATENSRREAGCLVSSYPFP